MRTGGGGEAGKGGCRISPVANESTENPLLSRCSAVSLPVKERKNSARALTRKRFVQGYEARTLEDATQHCRRVRHNRPQPLQNTLKKKSTSISYEYKSSNAAHDQANKHAHSPGSTQQFPFPLARNTSLQHTAGWRRLCGRDAGMYPALQRRKPKTPVRARRRVGKFLENVKRK